MKTQKTMIMAFVLALGLSAVPLTACQKTAPADERELFQQPEEQEKQGSSLMDLKTMSDVFALEGEGETATWDEKHYVYVTYVDGAAIRAVAELTPEVSEKVNELDFMADDYDEQRNEVLGSLPIMIVEDLSVGVPKQEELDALAGKTGQELYSEGYEFQGLNQYGDDVETIANMDKGLYRYEVTFNEKIPTDSDSSDANLVADLTVKSVRYVELSQSAVDPANMFPNS